MWVNETRVRSGFLILPDAAINTKTGEWEWRWWRDATWVEEYISDRGAWERMRWVDDNL